MENTKTTFTIENKKVDIYSTKPSPKPCDAPKNFPTIYLNMYQDAGSEIFSALKKLTSLSFVLVAISGLNWDADMCPWECPPISKNDTPCSGGADKYLETLTQKIILRVEEEFPAPVFRGIVGYSLGGLFALYSIYKTEFFSRVASVSGSLWFPDFAEFCLSKEFVKKPERVYFSLGDKEAASSNKVLKCIQEKTQTVFSHFKSLGLETIFHLNTGGHFVDAIKRTAEGIAWLLK